MVRFFHQLVCLFFWRIMDIILLDCSLVYSLYIEEQLDWVLKLWIIVSIIIQFFFCVLAFNSAMKNFRLAWFFCLDGHRLSFYSSGDVSHKLFLKHNRLLFNIKIQVLVDFRRCYFNKYLNFSCVIFSFLDYILYHNLYLLCLTSISIKLSLVTFYFFCFIYFSVIFSSLLCSWMLFSVLSFLIL